MTTNQVHLEDVARAARQGIVLAVAAALFALATLLAAGLAPAVAAPTAIAILAVGCASGGFGLVVRISMRPSRPPRVPRAEGAPAVSPLHIPQPR